METVIYLDVLVILNLYVSYFLFLGSAKLISEKLKKWRLFCGSILGGIFALIILLPLSTLILTFVKLLMGLALVLVAFPFGSLKHILKCVLSFFLINFLYGGLMFALWFFIAPKGMAYKNGVTYFHITALELAVATIIAYLLVTLVCNLLNRRVKTAEKAELLLSFCGREVVMQGLCDNGNKLSDVFSGLPVVVCEYNAVSTMFPKKLQNYFKSPLTFCPEDTFQASYLTKLRLIPVEVVGAALTLPAFKPDKLVINSIERAAIVAVTNRPLSNGEFQAVLNAALL